RYLAQAQVGLTWASVRERERLLRDAPGLVEPLAFLLPVYWGSHPGRLIYGFGLELYDRLGGLHAHRYLGREAFVLAAPHVSQDQLQGGYIFRDAQTDDARLVFRLIREAARHGGTALNYSRVEELLRDGDGRVAGVAVRDVAGTDGEGRGGSVARVHARAVVNATGAWADRLREQVGGRPRLRPLRGSHLIFPGWRLPLSAAVSFIHPNDGRPVYAYPWQGVPLVGPADVDHGEDLDRGGAISPREAAYLLRAVQTAVAARHLAAGAPLARDAGQADYPPRYGPPGPPAAPGPAPGAAAGRSPGARPRPPAGGPPEPAGLAAAGRRGGRPQARGALRGGSGPAGGGGSRGGAAAHCRDALPLG